MFQKGDYVIYGTNGVCVVEDIGKIDLAGISGERIYYTLRPFYSKGSMLFTPVDNQKVVMRPVLTKEEALSLIDDIKDIDSLWITDEKKREYEYKEAIRKCSCEELVKIIKMLDERKQSRLEEGKKATAGDEKYFHIAEENLYGELALSLEIEKSEVRDFIIARATV